MTTATMRVFTLTQASVTPLPDELILQLNDSDDSCSPVTLRSNVSFDATCKLHELDAIMNIEL